MNKHLKIGLMLLAVILFAISFHASDSWLLLCYGLALFLFGMQCMEDGLQGLAGGLIEKILGKSTQTPTKGMLFGMGATFLMQSTTLVSFLTMAFLSAGMVSLAGGIAIILGANLGATSGIWLLALAGQNLSLSPIALPLVFFGILASFLGDKAKAAGRVLLGIGLIFLGIEAIKSGFTHFSHGVDFTQLPVSGGWGVALFALAGLLLTVVLQSSHATLMITLAALGGGQLILLHGLAMAIGSNFGSSLSTAVAGLLGGDRNGQRLVLAHLLFNGVTAMLALLLLLPLQWIVENLAALVGLGGNLLIQLALFHTLFNALGVALFWPWQSKLAAALMRWLPEIPADAVLLPETTADILVQPKPALYLSKTALATADTALMALMQETAHLGRLSLELIAHAAQIPSRKLYDDAAAEIELQNGHEAPSSLPTTDDLYRVYIKGVYGELLNFMGRFRQPLTAQQKIWWNSIPIVVMHLMDAVKDANELQRNMARFLHSDDEQAKKGYQDLRRHLKDLLREALHLWRPQHYSAAAWAQYLHTWEAHNQAFIYDFRQQVLDAIAAGQINGWLGGSMLNDLSCLVRITRSLDKAMALTDEHGDLILPQYIEIIYHLTQEPKHQQAISVRQS